MKTTLRFCGAAALVASALLACGTSSSSSGGDGGLVSPDGGNPAACPDAEPHGGDACAPEGLGCSYGHCNPDGSGGLALVSCKNGQWSIAAVSCDAQAADAGAPCAQTSDCATGTRCLFQIAEGCTAQGHCMPNPSGNQCNSVQILCGCADNSVKTGCGYPNGFASGPASRDQSCTSDAGGD